MPSLDLESILVDPHAWTEAVVAELARGQDVEFCDDQWEAIRFVHHYFDEHHVAADARFVIKRLAQRFDPAGQKRRFELFPCGCPGQARKIVSMTRPRAWRTG